MKTNAFRPPHLLALCWISLSCILFPAGCGGEPEPPPVKGQNQEPPIPSVANPESAVLGVPSQKGENPKTVKKRSQGKDAQTRSPRKETALGLPNQGRAANPLDARAELRDKLQLKQLGIAIHTYHDIHGKFPMTDSELRGGRQHTGISWRVRLLPLLERSSLAKKFNLAEAWDSNTNLPLSDQQVNEFRLSNGNLVCAIRDNDSPGNFREITDGASNTIMLLENPNGREDAWTQPTDLTRKQALTLIKSLPADQYLLAVFYDGSTFRIYSPEGKKIKDSQLEAVLNHRDNQPIETSIFEPRR